VHGAHLGGCRPVVDGDDDDRANLAGSATIAFAGSFARERDPCGAEIARSYRLLLFGDRQGTSVDQHCWGVGNFLGRLDRHRRLCPDDTNNTGQRNAGVDFDDNGFTHDQVRVSADPEHPIRDHVSTRRVPVLVGCHPDPNDLGLP